MKSPDSLIQISIRGLDIKMVAMVHPTTGQPCKSLHAFVAKVLALTHATVLTAEAKEESRAR